jgi:thymidylate kinase
MSFLITIEGLDGTGKSTLAAAITEAMNADQSFAPWIYQTKEPGTTAVVGGLQFNRPGPDLRSLVLNDRTLLPVERELLFYVDASLHRKFIENQGDAIVVSDRGLWSHLAYLRGYLKTKQIDWDQYTLCREMLRTMCAEPDAVIYLKGSVSLMKERNAAKSADAIESNGDSFFEAVLETYSDLVQSWGQVHKNPCVLDALDTVSHNVSYVLNWLKGEFNDEQLRLGRAN